MREEREKKFSDFRSVCFIVSIFAQFFTAENEMGANEGEKIRPEKKSRFGCDRFVECDHEKIEIVFLSVSQFNSSHNDYDSYCVLIRDGNRKFNEKKKRQQNNGFDETRATERSFVARSKICRNFKKIFHR